MILGVPKRWPVLVSLVTGAALVGCSYPGDRPAGYTTTNPAQSVDALDTSFTFYARIGHKAAAHGDYETAIGFYRRALARNTRTTEAHVGIGQAYEAIGRYHEAASAFRTALRQDPDNKAATLGLATAHLAYGNPEDAVMLLSRDLAKTTDPAFFNQLGVAYDLLGRYDDAQAAYRRGLEYEPNHPGLSNNLAISLALSGDYEDANSMLRSLSSTRPDASLIENRQLVTRAKERKSAGEANADLRDKAQIVLALRMGLAEREELTYHKFEARAWRTPKAAEMAFGEANLPEDASVEMADEAPVPDLAPNSEFDIPSAVAANPPPAPQNAEPTSAALAQESELVPVELKHGAAGGTRVAVASTARPKLPASTGANAFQVQLGSFRSPDRARSYWATVSLVAPKLLEPVDASVERADLGPGKGTFFRLRTKPIDGRASADRLCSRLKARKIECLVVTYRPEAMPPPSSEPVAGVPPGTGKKGT